MPKIALRPRERKLLVGGIALILVVGLYVVVERPVSAYRQSSKDLVEARHNLTDAREWSKQVSEARQSERTIQDLARARGRGFVLFDFLEELLPQLGLRERANFHDRPLMASSRSVQVVELNIKGVSLQEVVDLFCRIHESKKLVVLRNLEWLKPMQNGKGLECRLFLASPKD